MIFSSSSFLFYFFPLALILVFVANRSLIVLLLLSLIFYAWGEPVYVLLLIFVIVFNYWMGNAICADSERRKLLFVLAIGIDLAVLVVFKYSTFIVGNLNVALNATGLAELPLPHLALPLGISFFTFQAIAYQTDIYRRTIVPAPSLLRFGVFKSLFPQLIAGPIVRYQQVADDLAHDHRSWTLFASGAGRFAAGLAKKAIIADSLAPAVDQLFGLPVNNVSFVTSWLAAICFALQIYFDFSGYSDMAIGMACMFGVRFPENFQHPYTSQSIQEFWRRWHITLSMWFRDYIYIPLGGSRRGELRTYLNLCIVFVLCGFWHGATWLFLAWGLFHGAFLVLERTPFGRLIARAPAPLRHVYALVVIVFGWVLFRAPSFDYALATWKAMLGQYGWNIPSIDWPTRVYSFNAFTVIIIVFGIIASVSWRRAAMRSIVRFLPNRSAREYCVTLAYPAGLAVLMALSFGFIATQTHLAFIYFRF